MMWLLWMVAWAGDDGRNREPCKDDPTKLCLVQEGPVDVEVTVVPPPGAASDSRRKVVRIEVCSPANPSCVLLVETGTTGSNPSKVFVDRAWPVVRRVSWVPSKRGARRALRRLNKRR